MEKIIEDMHMHLKAGVNDYNIMENYTKKCIEKGLEKVLFLDHGNRISSKHTPVLNSNEKIIQFFNLIDKIRKDYNNITIYKGIEVDFSFDTNFQKREIELMKNFDYVIGSIHSLKNLKITNKQEYYEATLTMLDIYPINILGHLKLDENYLNYSDLLEQIVKKCSEKNIIIEINTSDRSLWTLEQMQLMFNLFNKYNIKYTIGSDAHSIDELGTNYELVKNRINEMNALIEYSIVSRGTEKNGSKGYMSITKEINDNRYLVIENHNKQYVSSYKDKLICSNYKINNIVFSRFELIPALLFSRIKITDNILLCGLGDIGLSTLIYLLDNGYKNITIYVRYIYDYINIDLINKKYNSNIVININSFYNEYDSYIDTTGSSEVLSNIFSNIKYLKQVFLLGTPRESNYLIDPLLIHRNNLMVIGGHELKGISFETRQEIFNKLLIQNKDNELIDTFINTYLYNDNIIENILDKKNNYIEVIEYDNRNK